MASLADLNGTYTLDPAHSEIGFVTRHAMVTKVRGSFKEFTGTARTGPGLQDAQIDVTIGVDSIDTRWGDRDTHLRSADFFDTAQYPTMTFTSTQVEAIDDEALKVTGDLTIKEVTRPITIDFEFAGVATDPSGNERAGFEGQATINRKYYGLTWNAALESGGVLVSEKVRMIFEISAIKTADVPAG